MDTSDPGVYFNSEGISNHCLLYDNIVKSKWQRNQVGIDILTKTVRTLKAKRRKENFDCIIGLSGGLDSSYMLHKMVCDFGLRPLVFHVDGGWNTEKAVSNIEKLVNKLNLDLFTEVINWEEMRDFQLAMFKSGVPHIDIPQDMAFIGTLYKYADKNNISLILNGGNISTECVSPPVELLYWGSDLVQINDILKKHGTVPMESFPFSSIYYHKIYLKYIRGVSVLKPLNFINYNKIEAIDELSRVYGWQAFGQKHFESRFTKFFEGYWLLNRFGFDMRRPQLSSLILTGQMTRNEALEILKSPPLENGEIEQELNFVAAKLGISIQELDFYYKMKKTSYRDFKNSKAIFDCGNKLLSFFNGTQRGGAF
jgi:N-acetyl sugar amidotransferase